MVPQICCCVFSSLSMHYYHNHVMWARRFVLCFWKISGVALEELNLATNNIASISPEAFSTLSNLKKIDLRFNQIETVRASGDDSVFKGKDLGHF